MIQYLTAYSAATIVFLAVDILWLSRIAKSFYFGRLGDLLLAQPRLGAAAAFYAVYMVGVMIFAVIPALRAETAATAVLYGALFGFFTYATYDMTNYATLRGWPLSVAIVDMTWGTFLTGLAAWCGYLAGKAIG